MSEKIAVHWFRQDLRIKDNLRLRQPASATLLFPSIFWTIRILENSKWVPLVDGGYITL